MNNVAFRSRQLSKIHGRQGVKTKTSPFSTMNVFEKKNVKKFEWRKIASFLKDKNFDPR